MKNRVLISILLLAVGMTVLAGCDPTLNVNGRNVKFTAISKTSPSTKTAYGDYDGTTNANKYQFIVWQNADKIRIYAPDKSITVENVGMEENDDNTGHFVWGQTNENLGLGYWYADYEIDGNSIQNSGHESSAALKNAGANGLSWSGSDNATFYAAYPYNTLISANLQNQLRFAVQVPAGKTGTATTGQTGAATDVQNMPLVAIQKDVKSGDPVNLKFYPAFSTFEVHLKSGNETALTINSFELFTETTANEFLTGICYFDVNGLTWTSTNYDDHYLSNSNLSFESGSKSLKVDLTNTTITSDGEAVFTLFTLPCTFNQLSLRVYYTPAGSSTMKNKTLKLKDNGNWMVFKPGHKSRFLGLALSEDEWKIFFEVGVDKWEELDPVTIEVE